MAVENQKVIKFLTQQEKEKISEKINLTRTALCYVTNYEDNSKVRESIDFERRVNDIKKVLNEIKINSSEEEKQKELLEQNILEVMEKLVSGIDYWENIEELQKEARRQKLEKYIKDNLINHSKANSQIKKKLRTVTKLEKEVGEIYWEIDKPQQLLKNIKNDKLYEVIIEIIEKLEQDVIIHLKAIGASEKINKKIAGELREELKEKTVLLKDAQIEADCEKMQKEELAKQLEESRRLLNDFQSELENERIKSKGLETKNEELESQLQLERKSLPTLPKKQSRFKQLKTKVKTKLYQLTEKKKHQTQELIARIEVKK